ncbi:hypothetical protein F5Y16DRAFT_266654 [Xylariaceae sp. FL0255]|nr:hypothetical protein F5Y16DRAFT_266654 [Xylariaceae sp. FL0255]
MLGTWVSLAFLACSSLAGFADGIPDLVAGIALHNRLRSQHLARDDASTTEHVVTTSTCSWVPSLTTIPPMTTVYAIIATSLNPAAAVGTTFAVDNITTVVVATGVQNVGTCVVTAPDIIATTRVETVMNPVNCSYFTSTVTQTITPASDIGTNTVVTTVVSTELSVSVQVSQQTVTLTPSTTKSSSATTSHSSTTTTSSSAPPSTTTKSPTSTTTTPSTMSTAPDTETPDQTVAADVTDTSTSPTPTSGCSKDDDCQDLSCEGGGGSVKNGEDYGSPKCTQGACVCSGFA